MKNFWNDRFSVSEYIYGHDPNDYFKSVIDTLPPGELLLPGEGEGRNAVYAAGLGWKVTALDQSTSGMDKALRLAESRRVEIKYDITSLPGISSGNEYDMAAIIYVHFMPHERKQFHHEVIRAVKPGGMIMMEAFHKNQLDRSSGGPKMAEMLYTVSDIEEDFQECEILFLEHVTIHLKEGTYHNGVADLVRLTARKRRGDRNSL